MKRILFLLLVIMGMSFPNHLFAQEATDEFNGLEVTLVGEGSETQEKKVLETEETKVPLPVEEKEMVSSEVPAAKPEIEIVEPVEVALEVMEAAKDPISAQGVLSEARQLVRAGEAEGASRVLKEALPSLGGQTQKEAQDLLAQVNNERLFDKDSKFPGVKEHIVSPGESLYVIAKKYKTTPELIAILNNVKGTIIHPNQKLRVASSPVKVTVSKSDNRMIVYLGDELIRTYRVATGTDNSSPVGTFTITTKLKDPTWYKTGAVVPPGDKENILGTRWLGFSLKGYGIHGTTLPESIGTQATAGCVRMLNSDVEELFALMPMGSYVTIVN